MTTLADYTKTLEKRLLDSDLEFGSATEHACQLIEVALGWNRAAQILRAEKTLSPAELTRAEAVWTTRSQGTPLQYISGRAGFWRFELKVGPGVLIPRPETEVLVETLLRLETRPEVRVLELGPGSGNIGIAALSERPAWQWTAIELNPESLPFAEENTRTLLPIGSKYSLVAGDFFAKAVAFAPVDWVVANPPYVTEPELSRLSKEVRSEPAVALVSGREGLDCLRRLLEFAPVLLTQGGRILAEFSPEQTLPVQESAGALGWTQFQLFTDYAGKTRGFSAQRKA